MRRSGDVSEGIGQQLIVTPLTFTRLKSSGCGVVEGVKLGIRGYVM